MNRLPPDEKTTKTDSFARRQIIVDIAMAILKSKDGNAERFLHEKCSDPEIREAVRSFLRSYSQKQGSFLEPDVWVRVAMQHVDPRSLLGTQIGRYKLIELVGGGGMGDVFKAEHVEMKKTVAIKLITPRVPLTPANIQAFKKEWEAIGKIMHENVVLGTDAGQSDGQHYLVMEWLEGTDVSHLIKTGGPLSLEKACQIIAATAIGLSYIHSVGLVHRDIKPSNIFLTNMGGVKLLDLGIAATFDPANSVLDGSDLSVCGTLDYIPPERWNEPAKVAPSSDVYSLGCTFYELLQGHPPFASERHLNVLSKIEAHRNETVVLHGLRCGTLPTPILDILERMLHKDPLERPSASRVVEVIESYLGRIGSISTGYLPKRNPRRPQSDMEQLVPRLGKCSIEDGSLRLCEYHQDRADVRFFEQKLADEILEEEGNKIRIKRTPSLIALVSQMQHKTECAGHWGLMTSQREWLVNSIQQIFSSHVKSNVTPFRVLLCGIAGHVHFIGNATLILRALCDIDLNSKVQIVTVDQCVGPILLSQALLHAIENQQTTSWADESFQFSVAGQNLILDDNLKKPLKFIKEGSSRLDFEFSVLDVSAVGQLSRLAPVLVVLAHFLVNMWVTNVIDRVRAWSKEIEAVLVTGGELLLAIDSTILPSSADLASIREILASNNLVCKEEVAVWDLYDLDFNTRKAFLNGTNDLEVVRESLLMRFVKC
jgi:serine/threonine protein kinase